MNRRLSRRTGLTLAAASLLLANTTVKVLAQEASPTSSVSIPDLPSGPLGEQIQWFVDLLTGDPTAITGEAVAGHFSENALVVKSADSIAADFAALAREIGPVTVEPGSMLTTRDLPPTTGRFVIVGQDPANRLQVNINVSSASGLIEGLSFSTAPASAATPEAAAVASPVASIPDLPEGPLGEQIQWLVDLLNGDAADITGAAIEPHLARSCSTRSQPMTWPRLCSLWQARVLPTRSNQAPSPPLATCHQLPPSSCCPVATVSGS